ncbi:hypothetical protein NPIL_609041 [Nephila pilipes]|uniref:Uncharacterized protein n=1 Tax=Nephila pilipes TaxID=299642 RepID=A0A8X6Q2N9_NEPPI|nr:hypothetical protein NPIL_609041 [Nephila pilipes]
MRPFNEGAGSGRTHAGLRRRVFRPARLLQVAFRRVRWAGDMRAGDTRAVRWGCCATVGQKVVTGVPRNDG